MDTEASTSKVEEFADLRQDALTSGDEVSYPSYVHLQTHPDRLAAIATLFEMEPAPVKGYRVLELGCGQGADLIPIANAFPETEFVGIDLSPKQIELGNQVVSDVGLENIELKKLRL